MAAKYILIIVAIALFAAAGIRVLRNAGRLDVASRTWLLTGTILLLVSVWLWTHV
jgi:hypothetical protein